MKDSRCPNCVDMLCSNRCDMNVKKIPHTPYQVSECGMVWNASDGKLKRLNPYRQGNVLYVDMWEHGGKKRVSELVLDSFGVHGAGRIKYLDGNSENCSLNNLQWCRSLEEEIKITEEKLYNLKMKLDSSH